MKKLLFALWSLTLAACARPVVPEGGPKDTEPPKVVKEKSTPNYATRFEGRVIKLSFDEWIVLQDVGAQVLISPPLAKRPEVTLKKKTVTVRFKEDEVLRPNTTYTINFGTAVKDLHENNPAKDLRFVFSTGDFIDSLSVRGSVVDAFTGDPVDNIAVMLYDSTGEDSIIRKERPYYMARTDKSGQFTIPNIREGVFTCVAVEDANQNLKWDGDSERLGFLDQPVHMGDSTQNILALKIFKPVPDLRLITQNAARYGLIRLGFTGPPDSIELKPDLPDLKWLSERNQDSLLVWYDVPAQTAWKLVAGKDTVSIKALSREDFIAANRVDFGDEQAAAAAAAQRRNVPRQEQAAATPSTRPPRTVSINPNKPLLLPFNNPITAVDTSKWMLNNDSISLRDFTAVPDSSNPRAVRLTADWTGGKSYQLQLLAGAVTDFYGTFNTDTLRRIFTAPTEKQLGALNLTVASLTPGKPYILRLLNGNTVEEERFFTADSTSIHYAFTKLQPVAYTAQVIRDENGNRRWDAGDYFAHRQPELVYSRKLDPLRANWEVESTLDIDPEKGGGRRKGRER